MSAAMWLVLIEWPALNRTSQRIGLGGPHDGGFMRQPL